MGELKESIFYKQKIYEMVEKINNIDFLRKIYSFVKAFVEE